MSEVPKERTPLTAGEAAQAFTSAWATRFGAFPSWDVLRLLLALSDLETRAWQSMYCWNFGNQISTRPESQPYYLADDSGNLRMFRAYASADHGAASFVAQLTSDTRPRWHEGLLTGDPTQFAQALAGVNGGPAYYEADPKSYERVLVERWKKYPPPANSPESTPLPKGSPPKRGGLLLLGLGGALVVWLAASRSSSRIPD